jgi:hypothetical protein
MKSPSVSAVQCGDTPAARLVRLHVPLLTSIRLIVLHLVIDAPPSVLLLDEQNDGEDGEAAEGEDVAEPPGPNVGDGEEPEEDDADDVVPDEGRKVNEWVCGLTRY